MGTIAVKREPTHTIVFFLAALLSTESPPTGLAENNVSGVWGVGRNGVDLIKKIKTLNLRGNQQSCGFP